MDLTKPWICMWSHHRAPHIIINGDTSARENRINLTQNWRIFWGGGDPQGSLSQTLKWMVYSRDQTHSFVLVAPINWTHLSGLPLCMRTKGWAWSHSYQGSLWKYFFHCLQIMKPLKEILFSTCDRDLWGFDWILRMPGNWKLKNISCI